MVWKHNVCSPYKNSEFPVILNDDKIDIKREIDLDLFFESINPALNDFNSPDTSLDRGWKNFDYKRFIGLITEPLPDSHEI